MPLNLASPGIVVREVDLTIGRVDTVSNSIGAIVAPFEKGPVSLPTIVSTENDLLNIFGAPKPTDKHYEYWLTSSSFLAYGGALRVVRSDDSNLKNAFVGTGSSIKINSEENYSQLGYVENVIPNFTFVAKNPGSWANGIKVSIIDGKADQILSGISTSDIVVGYGITQNVTGRVLSGAGSTSTLSGYIKGIITEISGVDQIGVKLLSYVSNGIETPVSYSIGSSYNFGSDFSAIVYNNSGDDIVAAIPSLQTDWYNKQSITLSNGNKISWNSIAPRPSTSSYASARGGKNDEIHIVVIDDTGRITGNAGTIIEKFLNLSKATDAEYSVGSTSYWRKYLLTNSNYIFGGSQPENLVATSYSSNFILSNNGGWDQTSNNISFADCGAIDNVLSGGTNYDGNEDTTLSGSLTTSIGNLVSGYNLFKNTDNYKVDFLLMGSANYSKYDAQALANGLIAVAEIRKDCLAFISPYRQAFLNDSSVGSVTVNNDDTITDNIVDFYGSVSSSTYAVFDSGYKYMYDRFNSAFRYVPLNGDIAGTCARNDIGQFPWYSPAGVSRGSILNAVKLVYSPNQSQRDTLYTNRINPVIFSPGAGIILFGDKTGYAKSSAFDRINVRRLFIYLERAISAAAKAQLFEFNDEITRTNFVNTIEPFLRDVQSKRGIYDFVVICDTTNNTASVIDNNEFVADIYIKPARSINFIGLTFVATKTGVSFEEVIGKI
jgi:Phage tail sheath protein subtilisin-like domain/Phage tail sheath C-terminal domain